MCLKISIKLRGVDFPANLIVLESKGIDVILGMDWLAKFDGVTKVSSRKNNIQKLYPERIAHSTQKS